MSQPAEIAEPMPVEESRVSSPAAYAWVILFVVFLASVAAPLCMYKVPPLMPVLMQAFQMDLGQAGSLMSVFAITGLILALPTGLILARLGPRVTGLIALAFLILGSVLGALSATAPLLLISRVIEGVGMGLISVIAPAIIAMWFPAAQRGGPMGIWATWVPVGSVLMYSLAPRLITVTGWQGVWWFSAGFALLALLLFAWLMRSPTQAADGEAPPPEAGQTGPGRAAGRGQIWLLALSFGCFNLVFMGFGTYFPTFLSDQRGYSLEQAAFIASLSTMVVLGAAPLAGWLSDRLGTRKWLILIPTLLVSVLILLPLQVTGIALYAAVLAMGLFVGAIPTATFSAVPELMQRPQQAGQGMAILALGQNLGMVIGPLLFGALIENVGWIGASYWLLPFFGLALIATALIKVR